MSKLGGTHDARRSQHAFTLTELLVVIAIIGILAAVVFSVMNNMRESSRRATCSNNVRTLAQGLLLYAAEHKGKFPNDRPDSRSWPYAGDWAVEFSNFFTDYVSDKNAYYCPSGINDVPTSEAAKNMPHFPQRAPDTWRTNISYVYFYPGDAWANQNKRVLDITGPARSTMIADMMKLGASLPAALDVPVKDKHEWNHQGKTYRDSGGHLGYADGHVTWFSLKNGLPTNFATKSGSRFYVGEQPVN